MRVVFLGGPSGVGKTTVARELQGMLPDPWLHYEVDACQPRFPQRPEFMSLEIDRRLRAANLQAARTYVDAGFSVLIEMDLGDPWGQATAEQVFFGTDAIRVMLICERRTAARRLENRPAAAQASALRAFDSAPWSTLTAELVVTTDDKDAVTVAAEILASGLFSGETRPT